MIRQTVWETTLIDSKYKGFFKTLIFASLVSLMALVDTGAARAELKIDITRGNVEPMPIAITRLVGEGGAGQLGREIAQVISANLERSGLFLPIDPKAFIQKPETMKQRPRFGEWRQINAEALVNGTIEIEPDGRVKVTFRLWDV